MGGKSSNSSKQSDTTNTDNRAIQQEENHGIQILGEGNKVYSTTTDHGAMGYCSCRPRVPLTMIQYYK